MKAISTMTLVNPPGKNVSGDNSKGTNYDEKKDKFWPSPLSQLSEKKVTQGRHFCRKNSGI